MEGRVQGDPRPTERPPVRLTVVVAAIFFAALAASALLSAYHVRGHVHDAVARDSKLTTAARLHAAGDRLGFDVPPGAKGPFITRGAVVRAYAAFYFLPAIQVTRADRVFHYRFR